MILGAALPQGPAQQSYGIDIMYAAGAHNEGDVGVLRQQAGGRRRRRAAAFGTLICALRRRSHNGRPPISISGKR